MKDIAIIRREYTKSQLTKESVDTDPFVQFKKWMDEAIDSDLLEASAATLSTASKEGVPSSRVILLKGVENRKFIFYTNYQSQKGKELQQNPVCALNFFWPELERQISIGGIAEPVDQKTSDVYFNSRPRNSQLGTWVSPQSIIVQSRTLLEERLDDIKKRYPDSKAIPRPAQWGGYEITPYEVEFWQGRPGRLHDRIVYSIHEDKWGINRLAP